MTSFCSGLFVQVVSALLRGNGKHFNLNNTSLGPSAIVELLVRLWHCWCLLLWFVDRSCMCIYLTKCLWWLAAAVVSMPQCTRFIDSQLLCLTSQSETMLMLYQHAKALSEMLSVTCRPVGYFIYFTLDYDMTHWRYSNEFGNATTTQSCSSFTASQSVKIWQNL